MDPLQSQTEAVKTAIAATSTCTSTTTVLLKNLLQTEDNDINPKRNATTTTTAAAAAAKNSTAKTASRRTKATGNARNAATTTTTGDACLPEDQKKALAVHVVNGALKALSEHAKPTSAEPRKPAERKALRRSNSAPLSPLQPRSFNRVSTSPLNNKTTNLSITTPSMSCLAMVECLRVALSYLRALQNAGKKTLPEPHLELAMSRFVNTAVSLGLYEHAQRELAILKKRLETLDKSKQCSKATKPSTEAAPTKKNLADMLDFGDTGLFGQLLQVAITTQLQTLRLMATSKKPAYLEAAVPYLRSSHPSSPLNLLIRASSGSCQVSEKAARQLQQFSQLILSLPPSISSSEDTVALESRLSSSPAASFELHVIGFEYRLQWWALAGHKPEVDGELLSQFSRCLAAFARRCQAPTPTTYKLCVESLERIQAKIGKQGLKPMTTSQSPMASIYSSMGIVAQEARMFLEAASWMQKIKQMLQPEHDSAAKLCSVTAQLLSVVAKQEPAPVAQLQKLLKEVMDGMQGPLRGDVAELDEMMVHLCAARRSVVRLLVNRNNADGEPSDDAWDQVLVLCNDLALQFPRFSLRWLGKAPARDAEAKYTVRFDQRRRLLASHTPQILDSCAAVLKSRLDKYASDWDEVDGVLQNCLTMVEVVGEANLTISKADIVNSYSVKVSQLYYLYSTRMRSKQDLKNEFRSLKRSIDAIKDRPAKEKERALLSRKLERFSAICKQAGRQDEARDALKSICTSMVEDGVLASVASSLNERPPCLVWASDEKTQTLSRTLAAMVKLDQAWSDWTFFLPDSERAAVLEHLIQLSLSEIAPGSRPTAVTGSATEALLRIYSVERFPIRRLRTLLHLLAMSMDDSSRFESFQQQAEVAVEACRDSQSDDDGSLKRYLPHLQSYLNSLVALVSSDQNDAIKDLEKTIASWQRILDKCELTDEAFGLIDNPQLLQKHLQCLGQFASLRGEEQLQISAFELCAHLSRLTLEDTLNSVLLSHSNLADVYISLGFESKAEEVLARIAKLDLTTDAVCRNALATVYLTSAEHQLAIRNCDEAEAILSQAKAEFERQTGRSHLNINEKQLLARANLAYSLIALKKGDAHEALICARNSTRLLYATWLKLENDNGSHSSRPSSSSKTEDSMMSQQPSYFSARSSGGPELWPLACGLLRSLNCLSSAYLHFGMFQETLYYAEKAVAVAKSMNSSAYLYQAQSWVGSIWVKAKDPSKGLSFLQPVREFVSSQPPSRLIFRLACELTAAYGGIKDHENEARMIEVAEATFNALSCGQSSSGGEGLIEGMETLSIKENATGGAPRNARTIRSGAPRTTRGTKPAASTKARNVSTRKAPMPIKRQLPTLQALMLMRKAFMLLSQGEWTAASALLEESKQLSSGSGESLETQVSKAACLIGESLEQMISDSIFSVVQDSTISFPSIAAVKSSLKASADKSPHPVSPPIRKTRGKAATTSKATRETGGRNFVQTLQSAFSCLAEANSAAIVSGNGHLIHRISALLQTTSLFLSAASTGDLKPSSRMGYASCSMELARNVTWRRERKVVLCDQDNGRNDELSWPSDAATQPNSMDNVGNDMSNFQRDYVDIIPEPWSVISISLSDNRQDLCITKLEAGRTPFVLRLPLERASSRDADTSVFDFEHGHAELLDIIRTTNETCHSDRDWSAKGAKTAWWQEREALDTRMKELLETIEQVWLSGFKGIFSQHQGRGKLLTNFEETFTAILDKHLPSRRHLRGKKTTKQPRISLDSRIFDLFIGLGDPSLDGDVDEALNDLLYFVVDILQFHGERNAYDEIDFDSMTIETIDALHAYHESAAKCRPKTTENAHTVLVLDKSLHVFPWESLPCMQGLAVSRVPSMDCLRRLILEQRVPDASKSSSTGHTVSSSRGTYFLNPGNDLPGTQKTFEGPLGSSLPQSWARVVAREPSEAEFETALRQSDALLYFGHGSGAQYIRSKTIRRMDKCRAAVLLMGCSSASLVDAGEFEVHGPVWNYMMAGCPAVVGTLWDVTDKDIDRYAGRLFEEWGLMGRGTFPKDKWSEKRNGGDRVDDESIREAKEGGRGTSLVQAVARARDATRFRYITAGAVCVYGIPVYIQKK